MTFIEMKFDVWQEAGKLIRKTESEYKLVVRPWELYVRMYGCSAFGVQHKGKIVSFAAVHFNQRARDEWGKYINSYLVYTLPAYRKAGYATALQRFVESKAVSAGYSRTKSLIQTYAGFRFHLGLGHTFWGVNARGELRCDSPLKDVSGLRGIPDGAKEVPGAHPLTVPELIQVMQSSLYKRSDSELKALFETHRRGYAPEYYQSSNRLL